MTTRAPAGRPASVIRPAPSLGLCDRAAAAELVPAQAHDDEQRLDDDPPAHLRLADAPVPERDRDLGDARPEPVAHLAPDGDPGDLRAGTPVTVTPDDNARVPVAGRLVAASDTEVVIHRQDARAGDLHLHFPRLGYVVLPA